MGKSGTSSSGGSRSAALSREPRSPGTSSSLAAARRSLTALIPRGPTAGAGSSTAESSGTPAAALWNTVALARQVVALPAALLRNEDQCTSNRVDLDAWAADARAESSRQRRGALVGPASQLSSLFGRAGSADSLGPKKKPEAGPTSSAESSTSSLAQQGCSRSLSAEELEDDQPEEDGPEAVYELRPVWERKRVLFETVLATEIGQRLMRLPYAIEVPFAGVIVGAELSKRLGQTLEEAEEAGGEGREAGGDTVSRVGKVESLLVPSSCYENEVVLRSPLWDCVYVFCLCAFVFVALHRTCAELLWRSIKAFDVGMFALAFARTRLGIHFFRRAGVPAASEPEAAHDVGR